MNNAISNWFYGFILLSRLPFHLVGILPFVLGTLLAYHDGYPIQVQVLILGIAGTICIMLASYYAGEYYDQKEDGYGNRNHKSRFAGGSQAIQRGLVHPVHVRSAAIFTLITAGLIGLVIWIGFSTGPLTIPLGMVGMAGGYLYSARPVRWVSRGLGELWIALCFGWLPPATAYYLFAGSIPLFVTIISIPIALSIAAVILINEYPDYDADQKTGKNTLLVRIGKEQGAILYSILCLSAVSAASVISLEYSSFLLMVPCLILGVALSLLMIKGTYSDATIREWICGGTFLLNCGITMVFIIACTR